MLRNEKLTILLLNKSEIMQNIGNDFIFIQVNNCIVLRVDYIRIHVPYHHPFLTIYICFIKLINIFHFLCKLRFTKILMVNILTEIWRMFSSLLFYYFISIGHLFNSKRPQQSLQNKDLNGLN